MMARAPSSCQYVATASSLELTTACSTVRQCSIPIERINHSAFVFEFFALCFSVFSPLSQSLASYFLLILAV